MRVQVIGDATVHHSTSIYSKIKENEIKKKTNISKVDNVVHVSHNCKSKVTDPDRILEISNFLLHEHISTSWHHRIKLDINKNNAR